MGDEKTVVLTKEEVEKIRKESEEGADNSAADNNDQDDSGDE